MPNTIGKNIKKLRQQKGISQDRLSKKADLALNTIVKIETGNDSNPTAETLEKIAKALCISIGSLFALPLKSLRSLEDQGLIKLSNSFGGFSPAGGKMETGLNRLFLECVESNNNGKALILVCKNKARGYVRSDDNSLLLEIRNTLMDLEGKSISEIYNEKVFIYK